MAPPPPVLMDELIEEILLFFSPADPASLVRAGLVCRSWWRIVSDPRFGRRFREFHRRPSMLGVFCSVNLDGQAGAGDDVARFVPTSACPPHADRRGYRVLDARHGRVLLHNTQAPAPGLLAVWYPITDEQRQLPPPPERLHRNCVSWNAAVPCAAAAAAGTCNHLDCHSGPFLVVFSCIIGHAAYFSACSSDTTAIPSWSNPSNVSLGHLAHEMCDVVGPSLLIGDTLHFPVGREILTYDLGRHRPPSLMISPFSGARNVVLVATEEGGLGVAVLRGNGILLCSHLRDQAAWREGCSVELAGMAEARLVGFAEGVDSVLISDKGCIYMVELKSHHRVTKVCNMGGHCRVPLWGHTANRRFPAVSTATTLFRM